MTTKSTDKPSICPLFFSRQYSRSVNDGDAFEDRVRHVGTLEPVEESVAELRQRAELFLGVDDERIARHDAFGLAIHHSYETIRRRLRADPQTGKILDSTEQGNGTETSTLRHQNVTYYNVLHKHVGKRD